MYAKYHTQIFQETQKQIKPQHFHPFFLSNNQNDDALFHFLRLIFRITQSSKRKEGHSQ